MIVKSVLEQWIGCDICEERVELSRKTLANPETVLMMVDELMRDHKACAEFAHNPRMAKVARRLLVSLRPKVTR